MTRRAPQVLDFRPRPLTPPRSVRGLLDHTLALASLLGLFWLVVTALEVFRD